MKLLIWPIEGFVRASRGTGLSDPDAPGFSAINCDKAIMDGLSFRPLAETVRDTLAWAKTRPADWEWRAGLKPKREAELLRRWAGKSRD